MAKSTSKKVLRKIYGMGRGWTFSAIDFSTFGNRSAIDITLHRLSGKGTIRRVIRGIYDYPRFSATLNTQLSPNMDQVAQALARKFGWHVQPGAETALNILGLSTQVPAQWIYRSDGPNRTYNIGQQTLAFEHAMLKETGFRLRESALIVHALRTLESRRVSDESIGKIRDWLDPAKRALVLQDTRTTTGWIYEAIRKICRKENSGTNR